MEETKINIKMKEEFISQLINKFNSYLNSYIDNRKINSIFKEYDNISKKDFINLV